MSKKKLSIQQKARIAQKHQSYSLDEWHGLKEGRVITRSKNKALIESLDRSEQVLCAIRPDIESLVVGDMVLWQEEAVVEAVLPRSTVLSRPDRYGQIKLIAANISQMIIVIAPKPEPSDLLIDSYLVAAELIGLKVSMVFNKLDIDEQKLHINYQEDYQHLCHQFVTNQKHAPNLAGLQRLLQDEISIFVGQSGVGKSSIIQLLLPDVATQIATSPLSVIHEFGQHTTSNAHYFHLPYSGAIIDSPGVRSFGLVKASKEDILWGFKEFRPFVGQCKFRDCNHMTAPYCAILSALKSDKISEKRYESYVKIMNQYSS
jgi:ribosome biogenesis GTPase